MKYNLSNFIEIKSQVGDKVAPSEMTKWVINNIKIGNYWCTYDYPEDEITARLLDISCSYKEYSEMAEDAVRFTKDFKKFFNSDFIKDMNIMIDVLNAMATFKKYGVIE